METLIKDIRYGFRMLFRNAGLTAVSVIAIALGIGANTAIFSVVNAVLLKPLPYPEQDRLMATFLANPQQNLDRINLGSADFLAVKNQNQSFDQVAAYMTNNFTLTGRDTPEQISGAAVTAEIFSLLGATPAMGRTFMTDEDQPGRERVVVVSHSFWERYLGSDPDAIGRPITLNGSNYTVIGVLSSDFRFPLSRSLEVWPILQLNQPRNRPPYFLRSIARLKPGVTRQQAQEDLTALAEQLQKQYTGSPYRDARVVPLKTFMVGDIQTVLYTLLGAVVFVLLIASFNVANLLLARATAREKEISIRSALGASRLRIVRQLLTESVLLAGIGGVIGLVLALWGVDLLLALSPANIPRLKEVSIDGRVLAFTSLISILSGIVFGLAPAVQSSRTNLNASLKEGGRSNTESHGRRRLRSLLVVSEFALALMLLIGAGLMVKSFMRLSNVDPGFNPNNILTTRVSLPQARYAQAQQVTAFYQQLLPRVQSLPGVESAAISMSLPPDLLSLGNPFTIEGQSDKAVLSAEEMTISPDYFRALGVPLLKGRFFAEAEGADGSLPMIINETMARRYFPDQDPIGKRVQTGDPSPNSPWETIVGVVGNVKYSGLDAEEAPTMYVPYTEPGWATWSRTMYLVVRTANNPAGVASGVRGEVWALDKDVPVTNVRTMNELLSDSVAQPRFRTLLIGVFAAIALILAAVGIYGVMSYSVTRRTHELGIRIALGAKPGDVLKLVVGEGMKLTLIGVSIGLGAAFALTRLMESLLFGITATDPATFVLIPLVLAGVALGACFVPARRATKVDPMVALRYE
ncbi:MAG TPA: ABC transporter permease [Blastocatellia bacterium]|nr:ABC transporter permease [Blastocatellia bacterium]